MALYLYKELMMEISSSMTAASASVGAMSKAIETQEAGVLKMLESTQEQTQETQQKELAKATGLGTSLDILG